jgi:hypothetical protein
MTNMQDSGERLTFSTGAQREPGKELRRFDLIPHKPLLDLAYWYGMGAKKYSDRNWQKGLPLSSFLNSAMAHLTKLNEGWKDEDHASAVSWNMFGFVWTANEVAEGRLPSSLDDVGWLCVIDKPMSPEVLDTYQNPDKLPSSALANCRCKLCVDD